MTTATNCDETRDHGEGRNRIPPLDLLMQVMEGFRPPRVFEKAHVYPVSVPPLWTAAGESVVDWQFSRADRPLRLYVHIPWCRSRCSFCFYESRSKEPTDADISDYLDCLRKELSIYCARLGSPRLAGEVLYVGGGTPSILTPKQILRLMDAIREHVDFPDGSFLVTEASPGTLTAEKVDAFLAAGFNRVSMGVQTFDDRILSVTGRDHDAEGAARAYWMLRQKGVPEINFDLMLALPEQSLQSFESTLARALELAPSSLSFLDLRVAPGSPLFKQGHYYPSWREDIHMRVAYQEAFRRDGRYVRTRPHYYVLPKEARARSTRVPCLDSRPGPGMQIGLGTTAYSHLGDVAFINHRQPAYRDALRAGRLPIEVARILTPEDKAAMLAIRAIVDFTVVPNAPEVLGQYRHQIDFLKTNGLVDENLVLTDHGCLFGEEIAYMFYPAYACEATAEGERMLSNCG